MLFPTPMKLVLIALILVARLHLVWLGLTIQHAAGAETKQLLPAIIDFTRQIEADEIAIGNPADHIDKLKAASGPKKPTTGTGKALAEETHGKKPATPGTR